MSQVTIKPTQNRAIMKFELPDFISKESYEFKNIDEAKPSALAQKLFYFPFVKTVFISGNFIAIERYNIVEWSDVQEEVANQISDFINSGLPIIAPQSEKKKIPVTVYPESTPNPSVMKFVTNKPLFKTSVEFKNIEEAQASDLATELFKFSFVKEVFLDENYVSTPKYKIKGWTK